MITGNKEIERAYWNQGKNNEQYEENNFTVWTDRMAREKIIGHLDKILCDSTYIVADLGCGPGHILPYLSPLCGTVMKIDYAEEMLKVAESRNTDLTNIVYKHDDMRDLQRWYDTFDIAIATNSILPNSIDDADQMVIEIFKSLKEGGVCVAVMPSIETSNWLARLQYKSHREDGFSEEDAKRKIYLEFKKKAFDGLFGFMRDGPENLVQKYFYHDDIEDMFDEAGFRILSMEKLRYSWDHSNKYGYGYFPGKKEIYDWLVIAEKPISESLSTNLM